jgi:hypothetical protein
VPAIEQITPKDFKGVGVHRLMMRCMRVKRVTVAGLVSLGKREVVRRHTQL